MKKQSDVWVRCPKCGHKLFKKIEGEKPEGEKSSPSLNEKTVEIKCHSCKEISVIKI